MTNQPTTVRIACDMQTDLYMAGITDDLREEIAEAGEEGEFAAASSTEEHLHAIVEACYLAWAEAAERIGRDKYGVEVVTGRYEPGHFEGDDNSDDEGQPNVVHWVWQEAHDAFDANAIMDQVARQA